MRPYLAIIKDSFREALASRVLWILLVLSTLVLALIAPFGIVERTGIVIMPNDITDAKGLIDKIKRQQAGDQPSPGKQIWALLSDDFQQQLLPSGTQSTRPRWPGAIYFQLPGELNKVIKSRKLYDAAAWSGIELPGDAQKLLKVGIDALDDEDIAHLNRQLLEAAYPEEIAASNEKAVAVSYLTWRLGTLPVTKKLLVDGAINGFVNFFVGVVGVFAGVLVTASIIPQTYAAGAIDLLLSKPISRSLLFLTKYFGGCMFILINAAYIVGGMWLIAGLRMGQWSNRLLLCIPVFMFLFAIYYAVSSLAGVIWRNAIVAVVLAVLFWAACFLVGATKNVIEAVFLNTERIVKLVPAGDELVAANEQAEVFHWSIAKSNWEEILSTGDVAAPRPPGIGVPLIGPVYDPKHERLLALPVAAPQFGLMPGDNSLIVGERQDEWKRHDGTPAPAGTAALLMNSKGTLLAAAPRGLVKLVGEPITDETPVKIFGFTMPGAGGGRFAPASADLHLGTPLAAAIDRITDEVVLFDTQTLSVLAPNAKGRYEERASREIDGNLSGVVAVGGGRVLLARASGEVDLFDATHLEPQGTFRPEAKNAPRFAAAAPDGKVFAVLFHNRRLWLYDAADNRQSKISVAGQGDISAAAFAGNDRLLVADRFTRVTEYELPTGKIADRRRPVLSGLEKFYLFGIQPIYTIFPKPGEMDNVVNYLLTGSESVAVGASNDLQTSRARLDIWGPIWSNLAFIAVVVGLGCLYTSRKDF
jgi:ABC-type transport system involved in multi-copper enzyme maturation permease subunit